MPAAVITSSERNAVRDLVRRRRGLGMEHELDDPGAVAQVDEDQPTVVAAAVHPAGDARVGAGALGGQLRRTTRRGSSLGRGACFIQAAAPRRIVGITFVELGLELLARLHVLEARLLVLADDRDVPRVRAGRHA